MKKRSTYTARKKYPIRKADRADVGRALALADGLVCDDLFRTTKGSDTAGFYWAIDEVADLLDRTDIQTRYDRDLEGQLTEQACKVLDEHDSLQRQAAYLTGIAVGARLGLSTVQAMAASPSVRRKGGAR